MIDDSNLLSSNSSNSSNLSNNQNFQNFQNDSGIRKLQQNLIRMGFDIIMVNKIISIFKIRTEDEALDFLIKTDDGMWNHPFIPKEIDPDEDNNGILEQPKAMMSNVLTRINSLGITNTTIQRTSSLIIQNNDLDSGNIKISDNICEICGESKDVHKIKEFIEPNNNNILNNQNNSNNNIFNNAINNDNEDEKKILLSENNEHNIIDNNNITVKKEEEEEENMNPDECPICMGDFENPVEIEKCKHKFCQECLNSYLVNLINHNRIDQIPCPKKNCSNKELSEEFFSQFLSEQEYFKFRQFRAQNEIARDSKKIFCPLCDSYASIDGITEKYDSNDPNYKKSTLKCQNGHEFCSCGRPLHENECYHDDKEFKEFLTLEKIKKCPKCGFLIKKSKGCNHMTCGNPICRYEFCWLCMKEAVPNHFDYGPCAGKQFFDPDSFSYRLQQSHPYLYCIYSIFQCIFIVLFLIIGLVAVPGFGISYIAYEIFVENNSLSHKFKKKYLKYVFFMMCALYGFCIESIIYILWGCVFAILSLIIAFLVISFIWTVLKAIIKCIFCCPDNEENLYINNEINDLELQNHFNDNNENNENNENIVNNENNVNNEKNVNVNNENNVNVNNENKNNNIREYNI